MLTVPFRTFLPSVFFFLTVVKDHSGDSLFSLLLDPLYRHKTRYCYSGTFKMGTLHVRGDGPPLRIVRAAVAVALLPPAVPVDQIAEVGRLLAVSGDELVLEKLLGCGPLQGDTPLKKRLMGTFVRQGAPKGNYNYTSENLSCPILFL